jgi:hypothetical protein
MVWAELIALVLAALLVERFGPPLLRVWWLRRVHWNADRSMFWSTMRAKDVERLSEINLANIEAAKRCDHGSNKAVSTGVMTINEALCEYGWAPRPFGDEPWFLGNGSRLP